ncbi:integral membrane Yip1 family protein [Actinidia rufa]|uniref:Integral membrane Yip1 family protein n=1 Tax=Actinidia rufa TaxID=165716 RepID=A0A7J0DUS4_9ERIC|nr:integral membrane Yip1 family protein [Actinidia rufa]
MAKEFNVPPVVFPSGGNPGVGAAHQRRLPTAPFPPPRSANPSIPFMSFDIGSAAASTSFSAPQFAGNTIGIGSSFEDEPPLLEELGINTRQIWSKTVSIINPFRVDPNLHEDADLSGPFSVLVGVWAVPITRREAAFRDHTGVGHDGGAVSVRGVQYACWPKWEFGFVPVRELDWVLYVADGDLVSHRSFSSARWGGDFGDCRGFRDLVDTSLHEAAGGACFLRGRASWADCVCVFLDLHTLLSAGDIFEINGTVVHI